MAVVEKVVALMVMLVHRMVKATATTNFFKTLATEAMNQQ